jgi:hypothetical protein
MVRGEPWSKEEVQTLKEFYTTMPMHQLIKLLPNRTSLAIRKKACKLGLGADWHAHLEPLRKWSQENIDVLIKEYLKGRNVEELARVLNKSVYAIRHKAKELGLRVQDFRFYKVRDDAFSNWSEESAYWLGFISADGYLYEKTKTLIVTLSEKDKEHLAKFRDFIAPNNPIYVRHGRATLRIRSDRIYDSLITLGVTPRKSLTLNFPNIPESFFRPYILGYSDGDGSIFCTKDGLIVWKVLGTYLFLKSMSENIKSRVGVEMNVNKCTDCRAYNIQVAGEKAKRILRWLYTEATIYLDRKYQRYRLCLN